MSLVRVTNVLNELRSIQKRESLSDEQMAARLGVSRSRWNAIRNGKQTLSDNLAMVAAGVWPELTRTLIDRASAAASVQTSRPTVEQA